MVVRYASARFHYGEHEVLRYNYDRGTELHTQPAQRARRHRSIRRSGQNRAASTKYENKTVEHTLTSAVIEEDADRIAVEQLPEFGMKTKKEMDEIRVQSNHVTVNLPTRNTALASGASERLRRTPQRGSRSAIGRSGCPSTQSPSRNVERRNVLDNLAEGHSRARDPRFEAAKGIPIWSNTNWMEATQMSVLFFATRPPALSLSFQSAVPRRGWPPVSGSVFLVRSLGDSCHGDCVRAPATFGPLLSPRVFRPTKVASKVIARLDGSCWSPTHERFCDPSELRFR